MLSMLAGAEFSYVDAQNMTNPNATGVNMINVTSDRNETGVNGTASNTQTSSALEEDKAGSIAGVPNKCLGSALCPD